MSVNAPLLRLRRWAKPRRRMRAGITQLAFAIAGVAAALLMTRVLRGVGPQDIAGRVANMLIALGVGVLSISAVVFTLLFMVVQWANGNLSPRLGLFRDDPAVWRTFGYIIGVFLFCFTAAVSIGREQDTSILVAITAVILALVAIALIRQLQIKAFASIQLAPTLATITTHGKHILHELSTHAHHDAATAVPQLGEPLQTVQWPGPGAILQQLRIRKLLRLASSGPVTVVMRQPVGAWLMPGTPLCDIHGGQLSPASVHRAVIVGQEPAFGQDTLFAFRLLADVGLRALSPAVNDPATAVQALDRIHELLRHVTGYQPAAVITGSNPRAHLILALPSFDDYLRTAVDDILSVRGPTPLVNGRLRALLNDLHERATPEQQQAIAARLTALGA